LRIFKYANELIKKSIVVLSKFKKLNSISKVALITGVTGQDGAYLSEFLLKKAISFMA